MCSNLVDRRTDHSLIYAFSKTIRLSLPQHLQLQLAPRAQLAERTTSNVLQRAAAPVLPDGTSNSICCDCVAVVAWPGHGCCWRWILSLANWQGNSLRVSTTLRTSLRTAVAVGLADPGNRNPRGHHENQGGWTTYYDHACDHICNTRDAQKHRAVSLSSTVAPLLQIWMV